MGGEINDFVLRLLVDWLGYFEFQDKEVICLLSDTKLYVFRFPSTLALFELIHRLRILFPQNM